MNREIKFRAWLKPRWEDDEDANKMYYDIQNSYDNLGDVKPFDPMNSFANWLDNEVAIIEQYTGLKDKNGKEIYEGDIVEIRNKNHKNECNTGVVRFRKGAFGCPFLLGKYQFGQVEVIGNVHEDGDLIGGEE